MPIIAEYGLELSAPGCHPGAETWNATAHLVADIDAVLPYLNAVWADAVYVPEKRQLGRRLGERRLGIGPREITLTHLSDRDTAAAEMEALIAEINDVWQRREELTPRATARRRLAPLTLYKLLPHTNCKLCGQPSCYAFAGQLALGNAELELCSPLAGEPEYAPQYQALKDMIAAAR